jgi:cytochrome c551/c552
MEKKNLIGIYRLGLLIAFSTILICATTLYYINSNDASSSTGCAVVYEPEPAGGNAAISNHTGDSLFKFNCDACHAVSQIKVGPALSGLSQKRSMDWIHAFVRNPAEMASKDTAAQALLKKYSPIVMPNYDFLTEAEIDSIIDFIDEAGSN